MADKDKEGLGCSDCLVLGCRYIYILYCNHGTLLSFHWCFLCFQATLDAERAGDMMMTLPINVEPYDSKRLPVNDIKGFNSTHVQQ